MSRRRLELEDLDRKWLEDLLRDTPRKEEEEALDRLWLSRKVTKITNPQLALPGVPGLSETKLRSLRSQTIPLRSIESDKYLSSLSHKDSDSSPIEVQFLPKEATGTAFSVGMSLHPGRRDVGFHAVWNRDIGKDLARLKDVYDIRMIVPLVETHEFVRIHVPDYVEDCLRAGFRVLPYPFPDGGVPPSFMEVHHLCSQIWAAAQQGNVLVHCRGGLGRTGTICVALLSTVDHDIKQAIQLVRSTRRSTIENSRQLAWLESYAAWIK